MNIYLTFTYSFLLVSIAAMLTMFTFKVDVNRLHKTELKYEIVSRDELAKSRGISKQVLFSRLPEMLTGRAFLLYRFRKFTLTKLDEVVTTLGTEFLPIDCDERLLNEIKNLTTGFLENMSSYLAVMHNLFQPLTTPLSETKQVYYIRQNLSPFYQNALTLTPVSNIAQLSALGKQLQQNQYFVQTFKSPPSRKFFHILGPSLAYFSISSSSDTDTNLPTHSSKRNFKNPELSSAAVVYNPKGKEM
ncbi:hypothetical protein FQA39_LY05279 [Lamprigera yunnana]|nr:hypothetical protein FQA39_LY05279 [Lamprigera yunnana]